MTTILMQHARRVAGSAVFAAVALTVAACDTHVTNPGPIQATFLENKNAINALVNGAGRNLAEAVNWTAYTGGAVSREIFPAGSTGSFGITVQQQSGKLTVDEGNTFWNLSACRSAAAP